MRILITGIAGSGKTTAIKALQEKGYRAIDLDDTNICSWVHKQTGQEAEYVTGAGPEWIEAHRWQVIPERLVSLLESVPRDEIFFVGGKIAKKQISEVMGFFDRTFLLQPRDTIVDGRLEHRKSNTVGFGREKGERASVLSHRADFEQACLNAGAVSIGNDGDIKELLAYLVKGIRENNREFGNQLR